jgi:translocator protein
MTPLARMLPGLHRSSISRRRGADLAIVASPLAVGAISGAITAPAITGWYRTLDRPGWNPPDAIFGPVWTGLYAAMGIALQRVVRADEASAARHVAVGLFGIQLALNFGWSWVFFAQRQIGLAVVDIVALWLAIVATLIAFGRLSTSAAALMLPYLAWVTFAAALNVAIWQRNR